MNAITAIPDWAFRPVGYWPIRDMQAQCHSLGMETWLLVFILTNKFCVQYNFYSQRDCYSHSWLTKDKLDKTGYPSISFPLLLSLSLIPLPLPLSFSSSPPLLVEHNEVEEQARQDRSVINNHLRTLLTATGKNCTALHCTAELGNMLFFTMRLKRVPDLKCRSQKPLRCFRVLFHPIV